MNNKILQGVIVLYLICGGNTGIANTHSINKTRMIWPDRAALTTGLAIDNKSIITTDNMYLSLCEATKYKKNPIITNSNNGSDSLRVGFPVWVIRENGTYRMWYYADNGTYPPGLGYAESKDGYIWHKPILNIINKNGSTKNNLVALNVGQVSIYPDYPNNRYIMATGGIITDKYFNENEKQRYGKSAPSLKTFYYSNDGFHWKPDPDILFPIHSKLEGSILYKMNNQWILANQMISGEYAEVSPWSRYIGIYTSSDLVKWNRHDKPGFFFTPDTDRRNAQTHVSIGYQDYGDVMVAAQGVFHNSPELSDTETDITLILSNNGQDWREPLPKNAVHYLLRRGDRGSWDHSFIVQGNILNAGKKTLIYYTGRSHGGNTAVSHNNKNIVGKVQAGVAELTLDRYGYFAPQVGWNCSKKTYEGTAISRDILVTDPSTVLYLNTKAGPDINNRILVEIQDMNNNPIRGYEEQSCDPITINSIGVPVTWNGNSSLANLAGEKIKIKFRSIGTNPHKEHTVRLTLPRLYAFYLDIPTLWNKTQQIIYTGRGIGRLDFRDAFLQRIKGINISSTDNVVITCKDISKTKAIISFSKNTTVTINYPQLLRVTTAGRMFTAINGKVSFPVIRGKPVLLKINSI